MDDKIRSVFNKESVARGIFFVAAFFAVISVLAIVGYLLYAGIPAMREIGFFNFLFGTSWSPGYEGAHASENFGILPMIVGSTVATGGALLVGGTLGILVAVFSAYFCPAKLRGFMDQTISLLAGIPSVVYGYFGLKQIVPLLAKISPNGNGTGVLAVSLVLGVMILPTVASIAKNGLLAVPSHYYEGAVALGMNKSQAVFKVMVPSASSGIMTALGLGIGRAVGETMAVIMIAGNTVQFPDSLFEGFMTLTGNIVLDMSYATGIHRSALVATGFVLLLFILALNAILYAIRAGSKRKKGSDGERRRKKLPEGRCTGNIKYVSSTAPYTFLKGACIAATVITFAALGYLIIFVLVMGIPHITLSFLFGESGSGKISLAPAFVSTGALILISLAIALPLGICAAVYLVEYSRSDSKIVKVIRLFTDTLSGIPSIVFGLFGVIVFNDAFGLGYSLLSGGLTLSVMILPTVIRSVEESLLSVPLMLREASFALGAGKLHTIFKVVLPCAVRGILTAVILSIGRIVSESAALILTAGSVSNMPRSIMSPGSSFAVMMYMFVTEGLYMNEAYATAVVLMFLVIIINILVALTGVKKKEKKKVC